MDDGSTDDSVAVMRSYDDPRVRVVENEKNLGLPHTRNRGLELAFEERGQGPYRPCRDVIGAIGHGRAVIGGHQRGQDFRRHTGRIVTGKVHPTLTSLANPALLRPRRARLPSAA